MKQTKRRMEPYSFFDQSGICSHLEHMAKKGWMIDHINSFGWVYRRTRPKTLHFSISYYAKASEFDPEPSEKQKMFHDFCAHAGWKLACASAQMQIFYNESEHPAPIETEPALEVDSIHASAKKSLIPAYFLFLFISLGFEARFLFAFQKDPIGLLSDSANFFTGFLFLILALLCITELTLYFHWHSRAKAAAEHGEFLRLPSTANMQRVVLYLTWGSVIVWTAAMFLYGSTMEKWLTVCFLCFIPLLFGVSNATKSSLKKKHFSRGSNRAATMFVTFVLTFAFLTILPSVILKASSRGFFADPDDEIYFHDNRTWVAHQDELPLTLEDFTDADPKKYSKERTEDRSPLLHTLVLKQRPRFDADDFSSLPSLNYKMVIVKNPALYDFCREHLIKAAHSRPWREQTYQAADAAPWNAREVYRLYDSQSGMQNDYLLCYDNLLVEIDLDQEPSEEQMAVISEKLTGMNET